MSCQTFSTGSSSGERGGSDLVVIIGGNCQFQARMPCGLINDEDGMILRCNRLGDFFEVEIHRRDVARREDESGPFSVSGADSAENPGGSCQQVVCRPGAGSPLRPRHRLINNVNNASYTKFLTVPGVPSADENSHYGQFCSTKIQTVCSHVFER